MLDEYARESALRTLFCPCGEANWRMATKEEGIGGRLVWTVYDTIELNGWDAVDGFACSSCGRIADTEPLRTNPTAYKIIGNIGKPIGA